MYIKISVGLHSSFHPSDLHNLPFVSFSLHVVQTLYCPGPFSPLMGSYEGSATSHAMDMLCSLTWPQWFVAPSMFPTYLVKRELTQDFRYLHWFLFSLIGNLWLVCQIFTFVVNNRTIDFFLWTSLNLFLKVYVTCLTIFCIYFLAIRHNKTVTFFQNPGYFYRKFR